MALMYICTLMPVTFTPSDFRSALATGGKYFSQWLGFANLKRKFPIQLLFVTVSVKILHVRMQNLAYFLKFEIS